jgi:hypothetical protein
LNDPHVRCFAASHGDLRIREVRLEEIVDLLPLTHSEDTIERYRARMVAGDLFPPVSVLPLFGRLVIADGHKRYQAALRVSPARVPVEVWSVARFLADQGRQVRSNARKNGRIVRSLFVRPSESMRLVRSTLQHWARVARCLRLLLAAPRMRSR